MPTFSESFPALLAALPLRPSPAMERESSDRDTFAAIVAVALECLIDISKAAIALKSLDELGLLEAQSLAEADAGEILEAMRAARVTKAAPVAATIQRLARWLIERHHGMAEELRDGSVATESLRDELIALNGIGPATADAILLFALDRPSYPLDRATYRILVRHGWLDASADYEEARSVIESPAQGAPEVLAQLSEGMTRIGRQFCRNAAPKCQSCPLRDHLPENGPIDPNA